MEHRNHMNQTNDTGKCSSCNGKGEKLAAWDEVERLQKRLDTAVKANVLFSQGSSELIIKNHKLHEQFNQVVEVLKHYGKDPISGNHARFMLQQLGIDATVSSLSQGTDTPDAVDKFLDIMYKVSENPK